MKMECANLTKDGHSGKMGKGERSRMILSFQSGKEALSVIKISKLREKAHWDGKLKIGVYKNYGFCKVLCIQWVLINTYDTDAHQAVGDLRLRI